MVPNAWSSTKLPAVRTTKRSPRFWSKTNSGAVRESSKLIRRDLKFVAVGIAEINRVRDFVILTFEFNPVTFQSFLGVEKLLSVAAQLQMTLTNIPTPP